jgi:hypothetical protein
MALRCLKTLGFDPSSNIAGEDSFWGGFQTVVSVFARRIGCRQPVQDVEVRERCCLLLNPRAQKCNDEQLCPDRLEGE